MAGDASLSITPVMKWNFERSCYRWLVTRHPAQFERMDFTAQILQSASRARKAFYECGWAEAKVLIRPSDGKFERTPFFDTIIRRGLRNSTRFDASTLTEEEVEALGMHRDESLGFKLQIRHFRRRNKEIVPRPAGDLPQTTPYSPSQGQQSHKIIVPPTAHAQVPPPPRTVTRSSPCASQAPIDWRPGPGGGSSPEHHRVWVPESGTWNGGPNGGGIHMSKSETSVAPWKESRRWRALDGARFEREGRGAVDRSGDNALAPVQPSDWRPEPPGRMRGGWEGRPRKVLSLNDVVTPFRWDAGKMESGRIRTGDAAGAGDRVEFGGVKGARMRDSSAPSSHGERSDGESGVEERRACDNGKSNRNGGSDETNCGGGSAGMGHKTIVPPVMEPRGDLARHLDVRGAPSNNIANQGRGMDSRVGGCASSESVEAGAGSLLAQGYMRLAAMRGGLRDHVAPTVVVPSSTSGGDDVASPSPPGGAEVRGLHAPLSRAPPEPTVSAALSSRCLPPIPSRIADNQQQPLRRTRSPELEDDAPRKRRRGVNVLSNRSDAEGDAEQADLAEETSRNLCNSSSQVHHEPQERPGKEPDDLQTSRSPACSSRAAADISDRFAREFAESGKRLMCARHELEEAKMRFDEARRRFDEATQDHRTKRDQMAGTAAGDLNDSEQPPQPPSSARRRAHKHGDLHAVALSGPSTAERQDEVPRSPARNGEGSGAYGNEDVGGEGRVVTATSRSEDDDHAEEDHDECSSRVSDAPAAMAASATVADDITDVKAEAEILCGLGRVPVTAGSRDSSPSTSSPSSSPSRPAPGPSDAGKHTAIASLAAVAAAAEIVTPNSPGRDPSLRMNPRTVSPAQRADSPLPALTRTIPAISSVSECPQPRRFPARREPGRNASGTREAAGIVAGLRVSVRSPVIRPSPPPYALAAQTPHAHDDGGDDYDMVGHMQGPYHHDSSPRVFPPMMKTPRSPSACGETDSDHSDSTNGTGSVNCSGGVSDAGDLESHKVGHGDAAGVGRASRYHDAWRHGGGSSHRSSGYVPPLSRLADVAASGARGSIGNARSGDRTNRFDYA